MDPEQLYAQFRNEGRYGLPPELAHPFSRDLTPETGLSIYPEISERQDFFLRAPKIFNVTMPHIPSFEVIESLPKPVFPMSYEKLLDAEIDEDDNTGLRDKLVLAQKFFYATMAQELFPTSTLSFEALAEIGKTMLLGIDGLALPIPNTQNEVSARLLPQAYEETGLKPFTYPESAVARPLLTGAAIDSHKYDPQQTSFAILDLILAEKGEIPIELSELEPLFNEAVSKALNFLTEQNETTPFPPNPTAQGFFREALRLKKIKQPIDRLEHRSNSSLRDFLYSDLRNVHDETAIATETASEIQVDQDILPYIETMLYTKIETMLPKESLCYDNFANVLDAFNVELNCARNLFHEIIKNRIQAFEEEFINYLLELTKDKDSTSDLLQYFLVNNYEIPDIEKLKSTLVLPRDIHASINIQQKLEIIRSIVLRNAGTEKEKDAVQDSGQDKLNSLYSGLTLCKLSESLGIDDSIVINHLENMSKRFPNKLLNQHLTGLRIIKTPHGDDLSKNLADIFANYFYWNSNTGASDLVIDVFTSELRGKSINDLQRYKESVQQNKDQLATFVTPRVSYDFETEIRRISEKYKIPSFQKLVKYFNKINEMTESLKSVRDTSAHAFWDSYSIFLKYIAVINTCSNILETDKPLDQMVSSLLKPYVEALGLDQEIKYKSSIPDDEKSVREFRAQYIFDSVINYLISKRFLTEDDLLQITKVERIDTTEFEGAKFSAQTQDHLLITQLLREFFETYYTHIPYEVRSKTATCLPAQVLKSRSINDLPFLFNPLDLSMALQGAPISPFHFYVGISHYYPLHDIAADEPIHNRVSVGVSSQYSDFDGHLGTLINHDETSPTARFLNSNYALSTFLHGTPVTFSTAVARNSPSSIEPDLFSALGLKPYAQELSFKLPLLHGAQRYFKYIEDINLPTLLRGSPSFTESNGVITFNALYPQHMVMEAFTKGKGDASRYSLSLVPNSLSIQQKKVLTFVGAGGSGKSTQLQSLASACVASQIGLPIVCKSAEMTPPKVVYLSLNDDLSGLGGSRFKNLVTTIFEQIDEIETISATEKERPIILCLDELFRGTDDINATALIWATLEHLTKIPNVYVLTATHFMLLKDLVDRGFIDFLDLKSVDQDTHEITEHIPGSNLSKVLENNGYPQEFIDQFLRIASGEGNLSTDGLMLALEDLAIREVADDKRGIEYELDLLEKYDKRKYRLGSAFKGLMLFTQAIHLQLYSSEEDIHKPFTEWFVNRPELCPNPVLKEARHRYIENFSDIEGFSNAINAFQKILLKPNRDDLKEEDYKFKVENFLEIIRNVNAATVGNPFLLDIIKLISEEEIQTILSEDGNYYYKINALINRNFKKCLHRSLLSMQEVYESLNIDIFEVVKASRDGNDFSYKLGEALLGKEIPDIVCWDLLGFNQTFNYLASLDANNWEEVKKKEYFSTIPILSPYNLPFDITKTMLHSSEKAIWMEDVKDWFNNKHLDFQKARESDNEIKIIDSYYLGQGVVGGYYREYLDANSLANTVRNSVSLQPGRAVILLGDNQGGKTTTMKNIVLQSLLKNTWGRVIGHCEIPQLDFIETLTIVQSTDSESSSMNETRKILEILEKYIKYIKNGGRPERALIMFDELGSTISSDEGSALASLLLSFFAKQGVFVGTTTHYHQLTSRINKCFPSTRIKSYGFVYSDNPFKAIEDLEPGTSRGIERTRDFVEAKGFRNFTKIDGILDRAVELREVIANFIKESKK